MSQDHWTWTLEEKFPSELGAHESFLNQVLEMIANEGWHEKHVFGIRLALEEALVNAVRHGNALDSDKAVQATCRLAPDRIWIEVVDQGPGFDPDKVPDPRFEMLRVHKEMEVGSVWERSGWMEAGWVGNAWADEVDASLGAIKRAALACGGEVLVAVLKAAEAALRVGEVPEEAAARALVAAVGG